jgi:hypothetical protein
MKLNFWQMLGVVLLIVGLAWWAYDKSRTRTPAATAPVQTR